MQIFDLQKMKVYSYKQRNMNVFYKTDEFKIRVIELPEKGNMPLCKMDSHVIFSVIKGAAEITVDKKTAQIKEGQCLVIEPATVSMYTRHGVKLMGIQIIDNLK